MSKLIFEHMVCSTQTVHLSFIKISTISKQTKPRFHLSPLTQEYHQVRLKWFLSLWCTYLQTDRAPILHRNQKYLQMDRSKILYDTRHLVVPSGASKLISEHMKRSMQTVHLSCIQFSTISKQTKPSFHLSLFTMEYQQECPKWFLRLQCIRCKLCTYLAPKLTLSPNRPRRDSR